MKKRTLPSPARLKAEATSQLKALSQELAQEPLKTLAPASVHGARRRIKRLRSLLRLLRGAASGTRFETANAQLRTAADSLAHQRRADALLAASQRLGTRKQPHGLHAVAEAHRREHEGEGSAPGGLAAARKAVAKAMSEVSASRLKLRSPQAIADSLIGYYRKARKGLVKALEKRGRDELHEARKKVIDHLHHLELLKPALPRLGGKRLKRLNELREALGDLNDLDELQQLAVAREVKLDGKDTAALEQRRKRLLDKAEKQFRLLFGDKPKAFARRIGIAVTDAAKPAKAEEKHKQNSGAGAVTG